jgi:hypothetical protein
MEHRAAADARTGRLTRLFKTSVTRAHAKFEVLRRTMHLKIDDFLKKPPTELRQAVLSALERALRASHPAPACQRVGARDADARRHRRLAGGARPGPAGAG